MTEPEEPFEMTEGCVVLVWPPGRPYRPVLDHMERLLVFAVHENAQHVVARIEEEGLEAAIAPATAKQLEEAAELVPAGEEITFELETGWREDREHARFTATEFVRRVG